MSGDRHDHYNLVHSQKCDNCFKKLMNFEPSELLNFKKTGARDDPGILFMISAFYLLSVLKTLRRNVLKYENFSQNEVIRIIQSNLMNLLKSKAHNYAQALSGILISFNRILVIQDSLDALNAILFNFHHNNCGPNCPLHSSLTIQVFQETSCKNTLNYGDNSCYFLVQVQNEHESIFQQFIKQLNKSRCFYCKSSCSRRLTCFDVKPLICFKIVNQGAQNFSSILPFRVPASDLFVSPFHQSEFQILLVLDSNQEIYLFEKQSVFGSTIGITSHQKFFQTLKSQSLGISAVFYEFLQNDSMNQKVSKVQENFCICGKILNIGENDCSNCKTTVLARKDFVQKSPNPKSKATEENKRMYQTLDPSFKSKKTYKIRKQ